MDLFGPCRMIDDGSASKLYLLNYADDRLGHKGGAFLRNQELLNESARRNGVANIVSWNWEKLMATDFYREHSNYLNKRYDENGFAFKPFIILHLLERIRHGDIILYYDTGAYIIDRSIDRLVDICRRNRGTLFHQVGLKNAQQTKRDCFVYMGCDTPRYHDAIGIQATWFFLQKTDFTVAFVKEWLLYNLDERIASYRKPNTCGLPDLPGFFENRGDQSILSNLVTKYKIRTFYGAGATANRRIGMFLRAMSSRGSVISFGMRLSERLLGTRGKWRLVKLIEKL